MADCNGNGSNPDQPSHPRRFDVATLRKISALDLRILEEIDFLSRLQAKKSPTGARYCCPGEEYLARKCGVRREQISYRITHLAEIGVLDVTHRRRRGWKFATNLYKIVSWVWWKLRAMTEMLRGKRHRVRHTAQKLVIEVEKVISSKTVVAASRLSPASEAILARWNTEKQHLEG